MSWLTMRLRRLRPCRQQGCPDIGPGGVCAIHHYIARHKGDTHEGKAIAYIEDVTRPNGASICKRHYTDGTHDFVYLDPWDVDGISADSPFDHDPRVHQQPTTDGGIRMDDLTPRQLDFRQHISTLLAEYAKAVGPEFDDDIDEGIPMDMPACLGWVLVCYWDDIADETNSSTVLLDSGINAPTKVGLLTIALEMT